MTSYGDYIILVIRNLIFAIHPVLRPLFDISAFMLQPRVARRADNSFTPSSSHGIDGPYRWCRNDSTLAITGFECCDSVWGGDAVCPDRGYDPTNVVILDLACFSLKSAGDR